MNCAEFQRALPYIIDGGGSKEEQEHLRNCEVCADLVQDLRYIAEQAKLLVPMEDPSPRVWDGISKSLEREGLVKPAPARRGLLGPQARSWAWVPVAAVLLFTVGWLFTRGETVVSPGTTQQAAVQTAPVTAGVDDGTREDQLMLQVVADQQPAARDTYERNLRSVNAYIRDAEATVQQNPTDEEAKQFLTQAYEQKVMLYQMAARSGE